MHIFRMRRRITLTLVAIYPASAKVACLMIDGDLPDLIGGIHDERTVRRDRFAYLRAMMIQKK